VGFKPFTPWLHRRDVPIRGFTKVLVVSSLACSIPLNRLQASTAGQLSPKAHASDTSKKINKGESS
jgi:hypothetical protein